MSVGRDIDYEAVPDEFESRSATEALEWMFDTFGAEHYIACSFQKTSSVIAHMASRINPEARFFYLDTDLLFPETYETRDRLAEHLGIEFDRFHNLSLEEQTARYGDELWARDSDACCNLRKVEPMRRALSSVSCWTAGIRRENSPSRSNTSKLAWDTRFGLWKIAPLVDWTEQEVWAYIFKHELPYNPLHDQSYPSIGCIHCTQPVGPGRSMRDGRWAGTVKTECGIN